MNVFISGPNLNIVIDMKILYVFSRLLSSPSITTSITAIGTLQNKYLRPIECGL